MKNKGIVIFLIVLAVVIVAVMVGDWYSKRPDNMEANKFEFSVDEFKNVPEDLIHYKETKNFKVGFENPAGITIEKNLIYVVGDKKLKIINLSGKLLDELDLSEEPNTVEILDNQIYIAFEKEIKVFNKNFQQTNSWKLDNENSYITAMAANDNELFIADAGTRRIMRFSLDGELQNEFEGKASEDVLHGFIIPSGYFDIDINEYGDFWVVNPGLHTLENYTTEGKSRAYIFPSLSTAISGACPSILSSNLVGGATTPEN